MIPRTEAELIVAGRVIPTAVVEQLLLAHAPGRVLAVDARSDGDLPPFDRVTMDGYAVVAADGPGERTVADYVPAGSVGKKRIEPGQAARVMTGAPLPPGADAVVQVEKTSGYVAVGEMVRIEAAVTPGTNVAPKGEDIRTGEVVFPAGTLLDATHMAGLAACGIDPVPVFRQPTVAILTSGDELVPPSQRPKPGQIRNSNASSLAAQVRSLGIEPVLLGTARDKPVALAEWVERGRGFDLLIVSGGVSAGDKDLVPATLEAAGYGLLFRKVRIKPGKPTIFGLTPDGKMVFGLPGNPVSTFVMFELFVAPAIRRFMGLPWDGGRWITVTLDAPYRRKNGDREEFVPVRLFWTDRGYVAVQPEFHGSGHFLAVAGCDGLLNVPAGTVEYAAGTAVPIRLL